MLLTLIYSVTSLSTICATESDLSSSCTMKDPEVQFVNDLGFQLLNKMTKSVGNVFISPLGAAFALGMSYSGAASRTAQELEEIWKDSDGKFATEKVYERLGKFFTGLDDNEKQFTLWNGFLLQNGYEVKEDFVNKLKNIYFVEPKIINFINASVADEINEFFTKETNGMFEEIIAENETVSHISKILLLNAAALNETWKVQFPPERTKRDYFYSGRRETTEVRMMSMEAESFKFYEDLEMKYKFLEIPYKDDKMNMVLALPTQYDQPANIQMDSKLFCEIKNKMSHTKLDMIAFPKYRFETQTSLKDAFMDLGIQDAFNPLQANFSNIQDDSDLYVSDIIQKAVVEVNEKGNEESVITKLKIMPVAFRGVKEFIANHPFIFYVEDTNSGVILFSGRVDEPSESIP
ncbi:Glia-derived nexin, partial [Stegodyphus mimosarum]